jgi:hypothetical protein
VFPGQENLRNANTSFQVASSAFSSVSGMRVNKSLPVYRRKGFSNP